MSAFDAASLQRCSYLMKCSAPLLSHIDRSKFFKESLVPLFIYYVPRQPGVGETVHSSPM
jgi:hypothetical protein